MVFYTCPKCNKIFTKKSHFLNHVELKKKPCDTTKEKIILKLPQKSSNFLKNPQISSKILKKSSPKIEDIIADKYKKK